VNATVDRVFGLKIALTVAFLAWTTLAGAESWRFALIGDTPYSDYERAELPKMLAAIADRHVDFVAHIGDFKHGAARCDDSVFEDRFRLFNASRVPFVFVPGDNEWTDCQRLSNGAYDPLERLARLRQLFWADGFSLGEKKLALERQPGNYPEHARFQVGPVLFVTLNVPGGGNNRGPGKAANGEFAARNPAVLDWMKAAFALAGERKLQAVVFMMQANPGFKHFNEGFPEGGYRELLEILQTESPDFPGQVLVLHGDTHHQRTDRPLRDRQGKPLPRLIRVESYGYPFMGWVSIAIESDSAELFRIEPQPWPPRESATNAQ
jgi:hypothetical protein